MAWSPSNRQCQTPEHVSDVDVAIHQRDRSVDFSLRVRRDPASAGHRIRRVERREFGGDDRKPQTKAGNQCPRIEGWSSSPPLMIMWTATESLCRMRANTKDHIGTIAGCDHRESHPAVRR